ncbi:MAG: cystathionine beta-synthase [Candidatus Aminicenantes bacterium]|nr:cystathionine beta-synthase [Candidatus Aminicenantes bacterium]NIM78020.1 cystathionine beta-synthase [Candidatus Aminicenantes bacterium]NIN17340.1 cystathionine beta-synthase [Candidatus Aminicenantes bacterium]NIN41233.1 cystathionine beta-synthase [Candidatus Aminicenantes bacterium]NIN84006.1 cystathionine beta-synthase [Candidatus Aminicenantes bacterium]
MRNTFDSIIETIGNTPLIKLSRISAKLKPTIYAKMENYNPGGSVKDRIGIAMLEDAEQRGLIKPGDTIVEPTSGNTGVGLALAAAVKGYKIIFTLPDKMSKEKINLLKAYGAKVVVTPTAVPPESPESYYSVAQQIVDETPNAFMPGQYYNPKNPEAHYRTTGPEIWEQTKGKVGYFVAGMGTGGTISGVGKYLKEKNPNIKIIGADPIGSMLRDYFYTKTKIQAKPYRIEGIGEDIIPGTTHFQYIDEIYSVNDKESFIMARRLAREEGILVGGSSGSAVVAALKIAKELEKDKIIVVLLPDTGERYLSKVHSDEWMKENGYLEEDEPPLQHILSNKNAAAPPLVSVESHTPISSAIDLMQKYSISQMPVTKEGNLVGSIGENKLLNKLSTGEDLDKVIVEEVMEDCFPIVESNTDINNLLQLMETGKTAVLVKSEQDKNIEGIITRMDIIEYLVKRGS